MFSIVFKNIEKSEMIKEIVQERISSVIDRFPNLQGDKITITLSMENSPIQAGPDVFTVKFQCRAGLYKGVIVQKSASNFYSALADLVDHLLERLNRFSDKVRVKNINKERRLKNKLETPVDIAV